MAAKLTTLGLDLGTNSLGWAIIETLGEPGQSDKGCIVDCGVRIFSQTEIADASRSPRHRWLSLGGKNWAHDGAATVI